MMQHLTIAVLTFRRPGDLEQVLPLLAAQAGRHSTAALAVRILVVDNDPTGSAEEHVSSFAREATVEVVYANEATPGISAARNRALSESASSRLLVFIDDDERPSHEWLGNLLATWKTTGATAVVGPVISEFEIEPEQWIVAGGFFVRRRMPTGTRLDVAGTNNLLLDLDVVRAQGLRFDLAFGLSGGEDTLFTRELAGSGALMVWCDEAIVVDVVPAARVSRRWVTQRALSSGNAWSLTSVKLAPPGMARTRVRFGLIARGGVRVAGGSARLVVGVFLRRIDLRARGVRTLLRGAGMISGACGYRYLEYGRPKRVGAAGN